MSAAAIGAFAVTAAVLALTLRPKNSELALLLTVAAAVTLLLSVLGSASAVIETVRQIVAVSGVSTGSASVCSRSLPQTPAATQAARRWRQT